MPIPPPDEAKPAYEALLKKIEASAESYFQPQHLRDLAEAYAWLMYPNQSHGNVPAADQ
jgi:hypothetical protein